jgi:oxygen-dependent protoporphyrinogen oxidase
MRPRIAVIGGGISGLAAAYELANSSSEVEFVLLEAGSRLGGVLETVRRDGFLIEAAADNFLTNPSSALELCRSVGLEDSLICPDAAHRQAFVVHKGRLRPVPSGFLVMAPSRLWPMLSTPVLTLRGKLRLAMEYFIPGNRASGDESVASFVRRRFGRETFERLVQPLVSSIYSANLERLSIDAAMPRFREMERKYGSLIRATMRDGRDQPRKKCGGARYGQFASLSNGMGSLVDALRRCLPSESVCIDSPVDRLAPLPNGRWSLSIGGRHLRREEVDGIILATQAYQAGRLLRGVDFALAEKLAQIDYTSCAVVSLGYRRDQIKHALNGFGFVVPIREDRNIFSCSFASVKYEGRAPDGSVLLRVYVGGAYQRGLLQLSNQELVELAAHELSALLHIHGSPVLHHVARHYQRLAQYDVGHIIRVTAINRRLDRLQTIALAGSAYGGVGVPACIQSGQAAAKQILSRLNNCLPHPKLCSSKSEALV